MHTSNYRIVGFTAEPALEELATLAHERGAVLIDDLGSGALADLELFAEEPALADSIAAGCDIVTFSGDKLLGGPQAGIAVGRAAAIEAMRRHPLARALRIDKLDLAALDVVLRLYLDPARAIAEIPTLAALAAPLEDVRGRAGRLRELLIGAGVPEDRLELVETVARAGAGALPVTEVPSVAVAAAVPAGEADERAELLRRGAPAVVCRVHDGRLLFDLRAVGDDELEDLAGAALLGLTASDGASPWTTPTHRSATARRSPSAPPVTSTTARRRSSPASPARTPTVCARSRSAASPSSSATPSSSCRPAARLSVVDVPGHERFVRTMVAGATGVDLFLLVIAADDGVMPQTVEHLAIIELLGVRDGVVALTKADLVDDELLEMAEADVREFLEGTPFAASEVVTVSARDGRGLDDLLAALERAAAHAEAGRHGGPARLPVDRVFPLKGIGTVVTGTLWRGEIRAGDVMVVEPGGARAGVRSVQVHDHEAEVVHAGSRVGVNLRGLDRDDVRKGDWLVAPELAGLAGRRFDAWVSVLPGARPLRSGDQVRLHHGTAQYLARVAPLEGREIAPGSAAAAVVRLDADALVLPHDRFIVRTLSPVATVAGGEVLLAGAQRWHARERHAAFLAAVRGGDPRAAIAALAADRGQRRAVARGPHGRRVRRRRRRRRAGGGRGGRGAR